MSCLLPPALSLSTSENHLVPSPLSTSQAGEECSMVSSHPSLPQAEQALLVSPSHLSGPLLESFQFVDVQIYPYHMPESPNLATVLEFQPLSAE